MRFAAVLFLILSFPSVSAYATEPCSENSWFANPQRPTAEWLKQADLVFIGTIKARTENIVPYPNCYLEDKSKCAMQDNSKISVSVDRWEKGSVSDLKIIDLAAAYCAQDPPKEIGKTFRFYLNAYDPANATAYIFYTPVKPPAPFRAAR